MPRLIALFTLLTMLFIAGSSPALGAPKPQDYREIAIAYDATVNDLAGDEDFTIEHAEALFGAILQAIADTQALGAFSDPCWETERRLFLNRLFADATLVGDIIYRTNGFQGEPLTNSDRRQLLAAQQANFDTWQAHSCPATGNVTTFEDGSTDTGMDVREWSLRTGDRLLAAAKRYDSTVNSKPALTALRDFLNKEITRQRAIKPDSCYEDDHAALIRALIDTRETTNALLKNWNQNGSLAQWDRLLDRQVDQFIRAFSILENALESCEVTDG